MLKTNGSAATVLPRTAGLLQSLRSVLACSRPTDRQPLFCLARLGSFRVFDQCWHAQDQRIGSHCFASHGWAPSESSISAGMLKTNGSAATVLPRTAGLLQSLRSVLACSRPTDRQPLFCLARLVSFRVFDQCWHAQDQRIG